MNTANEPTPNGLGIMVDIESLDLGPRSVVTQIAFVAFPLDDPDTVVKEVNEFLPIQPQLALNRTMSASTILWWMTQSDDARGLFQYNDGDDLDELLAMVRSVSRKFTQSLAGFPSYEVWARGPQFDIVNLESLLIDCGESVPWKYDRVRDLRTIMGAANLKTADVVPSREFTKHVAIEDCYFQIECLYAAHRKLAGGK